MVLLQELIISNQSRKGDGLTELSPIRKILEIYTKNGELIAMSDSFGNFSLEDLVSLVEYCLDNKQLSINKIINNWLNSQNALNKCKEFFTPFEASPRQILYP